MTYPYPENKELDLSLLKLIYENGGTDYQIMAKETYEPLADYFNLSKSERSKSRHDVLEDNRNESYWHNRVQSSRDSLTKKGYLSPAQRGCWKLSELGIQAAKSLFLEKISQIVYPCEINEEVGEIIEGSKYQVNVNAYERNALARKECINYYGCYCFVCGFDFEAMYGERGKNFIHVHHIIPLSSIGLSYVVNPLKDLRPVCPNCHAIIHRTDPPALMEEIKTIIQK